MSRPLGSLAVLIAVRTLAAVEAAEQQQCLTPSGQACQIGPPTVSFTEIYVPELTESFSVGLPKLLQEHAGTVGDVLVEFYAPWCPHCQRLAPEMERVGDTFNTPDSSVLVCRVNVDSETEMVAAISDAVGMEGVPSLFWGKPDDFIALGPGQSAAVAKVPAEAHESAEQLLSWVDKQLGRRSAAALQQRTVFLSRLEQLIGGDTDNPENTLATWHPQPQLALRDVELGMVMAIEMTLSVPWTSSAHKEVAQRFAALIGRNTAPLRNCGQNMEQMVGYVEHVARSPTRSPASVLSGLYTAWPEPCTGQSLESFGSADSSFSKPGCRGTFPTTRGYTCSLWELFHVMLAHATDRSAASDIDTIHDWIELFFGCKDCRDNFVEMAAEQEAQEWRSMTTRGAAMLWMWRAHNSVNLRLKTERAANGANPCKLRCTTSAVVDRRHLLTYFLLTCMYVHACIRAL